MTALALRALSVPFGEGAGLEGISLEVAAGERLALVGASGAGKTTLLRAVAGLAPVRAGRVEVAGEDVTRLPPERRGCVYLHQTPLLFPHLDVRENVAFPLRVRGVAEAEVARRVGEALEAVRLAELARRAPRTLSGGQRSRVALARAIVARPAVLLLDEPLSALDPALREEVRAAIVAVQAGYRPALVLVTHDLDEAGVMADRIGVLLDRRIAQLSPPAELFSRPASLRVARFLGYANELPGEVVEGGDFVCALGRVPLGPAAPPPGRAVLVSRADALRLDPAGAAVRVVGARHRAHRTTWVLRAGEAELEMEVDPLLPPAAGAGARVSVDPRRVRVFPVGDSGKSQGSENS